MTGIEILQEIEIFLTDRCDCNNVECRSCSILQLVTNYLDEALRREPINGTHLQ